MSKEPACHLGNSEGIMKNITVTKMETVPSVTNLKHKKKDRALPSAKHIEAKELPNIIVTGSCTYYILFAVSLNPILLSSSLN